ncbi:hypothetical protein HanIR_Chr13g0658331 [Helianthus annuus]|nr:hypothetical protein HanIR_Chr13g0658331 [Helianthus annuus]
MLILASDGLWDVVPNYVCHGGGGGGGSHTIYILALANYKFSQALLALHTGCRHVFCLLFHIGYHCFCSKLQILRDRSTGPKESFREVLIYFRYIWSLKVWK